MTLTFDRPGTLERAASDWTRDDAGRPWLLPDPDWTPERTAAWLGTRAKDGQVPYTRVTTFVEALLEGTALGRWKMRRVALGMGRRPDYVVAAAALTAEERDRKALNDLAEKALEAAGPNAADVGTALHQFTERIDRGEPLGFVPDQYAADLDAYREQVQRITWLHREERMVCDQLETAGTPDGIGIVEEPDPDGVTGVPRIVDLKTGRRQLTPAGKFSAQLGCTPTATATTRPPAPGSRCRTWTPAGAWCCTCRPAWARRSCAGSTCGTAGWARSWPDPSGSGGLWATGTCCARWCRRSHVRCRTGSAPGGSVTASRARSRPRTAGCAPGIRTRWARTRTPR